MNEIIETIASGEIKVGVVGLGYVGLPLAVEFGKRFPTTGFDVKATRIADLNNRIDRTQETTPEELAEATRLRCTCDIEALADCDIYIVTVPTPIDEGKQPDLSPLVSASTTVGGLLSPGNIVIYESTVYPGCTEEVCVPILERESGLEFNRDFFCGYSPERINPGDKEHRLTTILKVTSGSSPEAASAVDALYSAIIEAGTHLAPTIKVAEAAKVIENSQRDINIAFVNELAIIFDRLGIDTLDVLEAAGTKWNFLPFRPGLVGGHCIGVDPYYLAHKAQAEGYNPEIILAGRRLNDNMGRYAASRIIKLLIKQGHRVLNSRVLVLGITFKENCPDIRNSRVIDVVDELTEFGVQVDVHDPWANKDEVEAEYEIALVDAPTPEQKAQYDAVVLAVGHDRFREFDLATFTKDQSVCFDMKAFFDREAVDERL
ncbi:MAG: nucleotide sugar dehydrogenase [Verrucomicrobia bacterium]|jgi:UDP-N-acetyl-D-glucosamine/UDP-N-acetyl-D-galactosamine dehydrogenase|nr:nucleotide sugar dehydrogenase [Verrucomicrobiota bacterium]MBT7067619.1 nucleotide sugar dehydrogenase [Verrucomicrobiota bacterium]MBT7701574.1 nucleotide sugar dehydrogenase [Verrucomicrobiota bacterium]